AFSSLKPSRSLNFSRIRFSQTTRRSAPPAAARPSHLRWSSRVRRLTGAAGGAGSGAAGAGAVPLASAVVRGMSSLLRGIISLSGEGGATAPRSPALLVDHLEPARLDDAGTPAVELHGQVPEFLLQPRLDGGQQPDHEWPGERLLHQELVVAAVEQHLLD